MEFLFSLYFLIGIAFAIGAEVCDKGPRRRFERRLFQFVCIATLWLPMLLERD